MARTLAYCLSAAPLLLGGCLHARHVQKGGDTSAQKEAQAGQGTAKDQVAAPRPVAAKPIEVMHRGGLARLQRALHVRQSGALDDETRRALERYQRAHDLASTGMPDYATCHALGVDPDDVFMSGSKSEHEDQARRARTSKPHHRAAR